MQILAKTGALSLINPPVYPSYALSNLSPLIFPLPFLLQEWIIPRVITANGCTIFVHSHPRHIYINFPITKMCA